MPLANATVGRHAKRLDDAARAAQPVAQFSGARGPAFSLADAYRIQAAAVARRVRRGHRRTGVKMGFTSRAKQVQMGLDDLIYGRLTHDMLIADGGEISHAAYCHPRCEPEIAFLLKSPMAGLMSPAEAISHVEAVAPAIEVIDSRYRDFKFDLPDVVADNTSASGYVVGAWHRPDIDISNLGMVLEFNGRPVQIGSSAAILGHPARSLAAAARFAEQTGDTLAAGFVVLAGGATEAAALNPGTTVRLAVQHLGDVGFDVTA